jgi:hypothetical protein
MQWHKVNSQQTGWMERKHCCSKQTCIFWTFRSKFKSIFLKIVLQETYFNSFSTVKYLNWFREKQTYHTVTLVTRHGVSFSTDHRKHRFCTVLLVSHANLLLRKHVYWAVA